MHIIVVFVEDEEHSLTVTSPRRKSNILKVDYELARITIDCRSLLQ